MSNLSGTNIAAPIVPFYANDQYATHDAEYGAGGYRAVANSAARNAIPADRRRVGMVVRTNSDGVNWVLGAGGIDNNDNWILENGAVLAGSETELLGLKATIGAIVTRTDLNRVYILKAQPATSLNNWVEISTDTGQISLDGGTF